MVIGPTVRSGIEILMLLTCLVCASAALGDVTPSAYSVQLRREDDACDITASGDQALFSIQSPTGISKAVIERKAEKWPARVVVRLHLKGLENFRADNGKVVLEAAVPSRGEKLESHQSRQDLAEAKGPAEEPSEIKPGDPDWMDIRAYTTGGEAAKGIPLDKGYFDIVLPPRFFEENPRSITLNWIDFYR